VAAGEAAVDEEEDEEKEGAGGVALVPEESPRCCRYSPVRCGVGG
jgi:hypothetical protein